MKKVIFAVKAWFLDGCVSKIDKQIYFEFVVS